VIATDNGRKGNVITDRGPQDRLLIDRLMLNGFIAMFPAGFAALAVATVWYPLIYLFWVVWPVLTWYLLTHTRIRIRRCTECMTRPKPGAVRCRACGQPLR
jgi:hypothetical protein